MHGRPRVGAAAGRGGLAPHRGLPRRGAGRSEQLGSSQPDRDDAVPAGLRPRLHLGSRPRPPRRRPGSAGGALPLPEREVRPVWPHRPGPQRRHRAGPALGSHRGGLWRRPLPRGRARHRLHAGPPGRRSPLLEDGVPPQALPGQQQRGRPQQLVVQLRRASLARVLRQGLRGRGACRRVAGPHGGLQLRERNSGPRPSHASRHRDGGVGPRRDHLHRRRRPESARERPQGLPRPAHGGCGLHQGGDQLLPRPPQGPGHRGAEARAHHGGRPRRGPPRPLSRLHSPGPARPSRARSLLEDRRRGRSRALEPAGDARPRSRGDTQVDRAPEELREPAPPRPREDEVDRGPRARWPTRSSSTGTRARRPTPSPRGRGSSAWPTPFPSARTASA